MGIVCTHREKRSGEVEKLTSVVRGLSAAREQARADDADRFAYSTGKSMHYFHRLESTGNFVKGPRFI